jgi:hypothetical protein
MQTGFLRDRETMLRIEAACARVGDLLLRARRLEMDGHYETAAVLRKQAVDLLDSLERPGPAPAVGRSEPPPSTTTPTP